MGSGEATSPIGSELFSSCAVIEVRRPSGRRTGTLTSDNRCGARGVCPGLPSWKGMRSGDDVMDASLKSLSRSDRVGVEEAGEPVDVRASKLTGTAEKTVNLFKILVTNHFTVS